MNIKNIDLKDLFLSFLILLWGGFVVISFYALNEFTSFFVLKDFLSLPILLKHFNLWSSYLWSFICLFSLIFSSFVLGERILRKFSGPIDSFMEKFLLSCGLGLAGFAFLTFVLGLLGLFRGNFFSLIYWVIFLISVVVLFRNKSILKLNNFKLITSPFSLILLLLAMLTFIINIFGALVPEIHFDAHVYHLALPELYKLHGRIMDVPANGMSYLPQNMAMLYTLSLLINNETMARLLHLFLGTGVALLLYLTGRKLFSREVGILSAVIFYLIPNVAMESWSALNDLAVAFYAALILLCLTNWLKNQKMENSYLSLLAIYMGFALGIKYVSAPLFLICLCLILYRYGFREGKWRQGMVTGLKFIAIVVIIISPWLIKNFLNTGTPFYPFLTQIPARANGAEFKIIPFLKDCGGSPLHPVEFFTKPIANILDKGSLDSLIGPLFLFSLPLLVIGYNSLVNNRFLIFYLLCQLIFWRFQTELWRYFFSGLPVLCLIVGAVFYNEKMAPLARKMLRLLILIILLGNLGMVFAAFNSRQTLAVVCGQESKEHYLEKSHPFYPNPVYPIINYINQNLPANAKILFVGESRGYFCQREYIANSAFDVPTFQKYFKAAINADELAQALKKDKITYILFNEGELYRLQSQYKIFDFSARDLKLLREFWKKHSRQIIYINGVGLYQII